MVRTRGIVPGAFRRIVAEEDASGRIHRIRRCPGIAHRDDQMFGSIFIGEIDSIPAIVQHDGPAVVQGFADDVQAGKFLRLAIDFRRHAFREGGGSANQHRLAVRPVFRLREQICRHEGRDGGVVCKNHHFGRTGRHIDSDIGQAYQLFGFHHIAVSGSENLVAPGNGFGSVGHCGDGLRAPELEQVPNPAEPRGIDHRRMHPSVGSGRGTKQHILASRHPSRDGQHEYGGEKRSASAGDVETDPPDRNRLLRTGHAGKGFNPDRSGQLGFVKLPDGRSGLFDGLLQIFRNCRKGCLNLSLTDLQDLLRGSCRCQSVELPFEIQQGRIPAQTDTLQNGFHPRGEDRVVIGRASTERRPLRPVRFYE